MRLGLHTGSIMYTNVVSDIRIARDAGYDAVEIDIPKLERYLSRGYQPEDLLPVFGSLCPAMLNSFLDIERQEPGARRAQLERCERLCKAAWALHCPSIQVIPLNALRDEPWPEIRSKIACSLAELADVAATYGIRLALEPVSFASVCTLGRALEVLHAAARENVGLCIDTFHMWTGGSPWEEVAALDPSVIVITHLSDATPCMGREWSDADRDVLPGDGILPLKEAVQAIRATGYAGLWSVEVMGARHWEWDPEELARELKRRAEAFLVGPPYGQSAVGRHRPKNRPRDDRVCQR